MDHQPKPQYSEDRLQIFRKMDAVNLQGIWPNMPTVGGTNLMSYAAGLYIQLLKMERELRKNKEKKETAQQMRKRLLAEVEKRITIMQQDNWFVVLTA